MGNRSGDEPPERARELLEVADGAVHADALVVVVDKSENGETERNFRHAGRRFDTGDEADNEPDEIVQQDEQADAGDKGLKSLVVVTDDLLAQVADAFMDHFGELLGGVGMLHRQGEADDQEEEDEAAGDQHFQRERAVDRGCLLSGIRGAHADGLIHPDLGASQQQVKETR